MASNVAYLPSASSPVARKRYTSSTTPIRRPSLKFRIVAVCFMLRVKQSARIAPSNVHYSNAMATMK